MKKFTLIYFLCGGLLTSHLQAQKAAPTPRPVPPAGPWLEKAPDFAQWSVTSKGSSTPVVETPDAAAGASPAATPAARGDKPKAELSDYQTVVVKTKPLRYERTISAGGRKVVSWYLPDLQITLEGSGEPVVTFAKNGVDYGKADFVGFDWISAGNFEGIQKVSGRDCLIFREPLKVEGKVVKSDPQLMVVACIDADSRMPVALQAGNEVRTYQFGAAPNTPLTPPADIDAIANQWRNVIRQTSRPVAKP